MKKLMLAFAAIAAMLGAKAELPSGYEALPYISSTDGGKQWINTGYLPNGTDKIEFKAKFPRLAQQCIYCSRLSTTASTASKPFTCFLISSSGWKLRYDRYSLAKASLKYSSQIIEDGKPYEIVVDGDSLECTIDGNASATMAGGGFDPESPMILFASNGAKVTDATTTANLSNNTIGFSMYYFKVTDKDGNVQVDLVPCKDSEGVVGMYDLQRNLFFSSKSTEAFICQDDIVAQEWWLTKTVSGDIFSAELAPTCWTNALGVAPTGAIGVKDVCHIENGYKWTTPNSTDISFNSLHLGAMDGSSSASVSFYENARLNFSTSYWHSGTISTSSYNRQKGFRSGELFFDCASKDHSVNIANKQVRFFLASNFHCDETGLVLSLNGSLEDCAYDLSGDNQDYRGSISLATENALPLVAGHANALGDPTVPREEALTVDGAGAFAVQKGVMLNAARGIKINADGFQLVADTIAGGSGTYGKYSIDCSEYELAFPVSGDYGFTKTGTGTVTFTGDYTAAGAIVVKEGKLVIGAEAAFPKGQAITVTNATLEVHQPLSNFTITKQEGATVVQIVDPIVVPFDPEAHTVTTVTRRRLTVEPGLKQPISLSAAYPVPCHESYELEVLRIESGSPDLKGDDFEDGTTKTFGLPRTSFSVTKDGDGTQHVFLYVRPVVKSLSTIANAYGINGQEANWSDTALPHENADYLLVHEVGDIGTKVFGGDSLTVADGGKLSLKNAKQLLETKTGEPVIIYPGIQTDEWNNGREMVVDGSVFIAGNYGDLTGFNFYLTYGETASKKGRLQLDAALSGAGTLRVYGAKNVTSWNGIFGDNTNYFGKILLDGNGSTVETAGVQVRVGNPLSFGGRLDEFRSDAVTITDYAMVKAIGDVALTNDMNRGFYIADNGGFNCDAGKTFETTWPISLNGTLYKHGEGTLILGGALTHETGSTGNFVVRGGTVGILNDAAAEGLVVKATNDFAIVVSSESTAENGFTGFDLTPPPGSDVLPKVTVVADVAGDVSYKLPICTVANDSDITADTFVVEQVRHYRCSLVAEPVDDKTTRYSLKCSKPGLIIVIQ